MTLGLSSTLLGEHLLVDFRHFMDEVRSPWYLPPLWGYLSRQFTDRLKPNGMVGGCPCKFMRIPKERHPAVPGVVHTCSFQKATLMTALLQPFAVTNWLKVTAAWVSCYKLEEIPGVGQVEYLRHRHFTIVPTAAATLAAGSLLSKSRMGSQGDRCCWPHHIPHPAVQPVHSCG